MGEIAEMMLDGTMDCETGEWNFDGEDGPGFPMTGAEAAAYKRATGWRGTVPQVWDGSTRFKLTKAWRKKLEVFGEVRANDPYHWQVRQGRKVIADWWPHKRKWRIDGATVYGHIDDFRDALKKAAANHPQKD